MSSLIDLRTHRPAIEPEQIDDLRRRLFGGGNRLPLIPGYEVDSLLGKGSFGRVYRAFDPRFGRPVAIKVVEVDSVSARVRIEREAHALARLSHPNVVQVYDKGPAGDNAYFLALEYIEGPTLEQWLEQAPRSLPEILAKFLDVARGLAAAHAAGVVHRDFKPANAMVGRDGRVRVLDFGLARSLDELHSIEVPRGRWSSMEAANDSGPRWTCSAGPTPANDDPTVLHVVPGQPSIGSPGGQQSCARTDGGHFELRLTRVGRFVGTPFYAAPEQYDGLADARSDQFSFFVALYEALYGRRPFRRPRAAASWMPPAQARIEFARGPRRIPRWLRRFIRRGLAFEPHQRHADMSAVADPMQQRLRKGAGRPRTAGVAAGAVALTAALLGTLGMFGGDAIERCRLEREAWPAAWVEHGAQVRDRDAQIAASLDDYAERWRDGRQAACHVTEAPRRAAVDECLDQGQARMSELTGWLTTADHHAWRGLYEHPGPEPLAGLTTTLPDPARCVAQAEPRASVEHGEAWRALLQARIALEDEALDSAAEHAERAIERARRVGDRSLLLAAEYQLLLLDARQGRMRDLAVVLSLLVQALDAGERGLAADIAAASMSMTIRGVSGSDSVGVSSSEDINRLADELAALRAAEREPSLHSPEVRGWLRLAEGHALLTLEDHAGARAMYREAAALLTLADPPVPAHFIAAVELNEALAMGVQDPPVKSARPLAERALATRRASLGPEHPLIARETLRVGRMLASLEDFGGAIDHFEEAEHIYAARDQALDRAFVRAEIVYVHWLAARRARRQAKQAERDGSDTTAHWAEFERRRHLALRETLTLERQLPSAAALHEGPLARAPEKARLWAVALRSYLYHPGCWNESLAAGRHLQQVCMDLGSSDPSCADGLDTLRGMLEYQAEHEPRDGQCQVDPDQRIERSPTKTNKTHDPTK